MINHIQDQFPLCNLRYLTYKFKTSVNVDALGIATTVRAGVLAETLQV